MRVLVIAIAGDIVATTHTTIVIPSTSGILIVILPILLLLSLLQTTPTQSSQIRVVVAVTTCDATINRTTIHVLVGVHRYNTLPP